MQFPADKLIMGIYGTIDSDIPFAFVNEERATLDSTVDLGMFHLDLSNSRNVNLNGSGIESSEFGFHWNHSEGIISGGITFAILLVFFTLIARLLSNKKLTLGTTAKAADTQLRWSKSAKPTVGGIIFLLGLLGWSIHRALTDDFTRSDYALLFGGLLAFSLGLWDDIRRISARKKMIAQIFIALFFAWLKVSTSSSESLFLLPQNLDDLVGFAFIFFITVGLMNSVNMLDNMDGISAIASLPMLMIPVLSGGDDALITLWMLPALLGFLSCNKPVSRIFMGDSGSMLLGFMLSWCIFEFHSITLVGGSFSYLIVLIASCGLYLSDTLVVVINRIRHGISPAQGGRDHSTHHLVYLGLSEKQVAVVFLTLAVVEMMLIYVLSKASSTDSGFYIALVVGCFFLLFIIFFVISVRNLRKGKFNYPK
jgi:UDP-GlcNAc:undecaprenyl-phosphate/decaprenyl-phosphate GlcNAc-1-phosphate transferase